MFDRVPDGCGVGGGQVRADPGHRVVGRVEVDRTAGHGVLGRLQRALETAGELIHLVPQPPTGPVRRLGQVAGDRFVAFLVGQRVTRAQQDVCLGGIDQAVVQGVHDLGVFGQACAAGEVLVRLVLRDSQTRADLGCGGVVFLGPGSAPGDLAQRA
ncbi:hypothetical protein [Promicromonospora sp. NPDC050249]|uniref:hypothetical protein n=1 Tax=Promicromonospora sp. NPDC050249 TaxID=3154743 RepID=UPI0033F48D27